MSSEWVPKGWFSSMGAQMGAIKFRGYGPTVPPSSATYGPTMGSYIILNFFFSAWGESKQTFDRRISYITLQVYNIFAYTYVRQSQRWVLIQQIAMMWGFSEICNTLKP